MKKFKCGYYKKTLIKKNKKINKIMEKNFYHMQVNKQIKKVIYKDCSSDDIIEIFKKRAY